MKRMLCLLLAALVLAVWGSACGKKSAEPSETGGVERTEVAERIDRADQADGGQNNGTDKAGEAGATELTHLNAQGIRWDVVDGVYRYQFPERDQSGRETIAEMERFSRAKFEDQPDDWFFGKTVRDAASGAVTTMWDRAESALAAVAQYGAIYRGDESQKVCYLTFDCGYENGTTGQILDILKEKGAPAAFFVNGYYVSSAASLIQRMLDEGHIIGSHADHHYDLTEVTADDFVKELDGLEQAYREAFPDAPPLWYFRPPSGSCNEWVLRFAKKLGYTTVLWSFAYLDYDTDNQPNPEDALAAIKESLHNGCVFLLHPESQTNVEILGPMIDWIRGEGYEILPLCAINPEQPEP